MNAEDVVRAFWAAMENRDWETAGSLLAPDVAVSAPVSGLALQGREAVVTYNRTYPGVWRLPVVRSVASGDQVAVEVEAMNEGVREACLGFYTVRDGQIVDAKEWWAVPAVSEVEAPQVYDETEAMEELSAE